MRAAIVLEVTINDNELHSCDTINVIYRSYAAWFVWFVICPMAALAYGVLAIGYYCWRSYAAFLPLCGIWAIGLTGSFS